MLAKIALQDAPMLANQKDQGKVEQLELVTSGIAHDFNNLLTSILGQSSLALKQLPQENMARRHIEKAIKAAEYATLLSRQLMTFAKNGLCESETVDLNQLVSDNAGLLQTIFMDDITLEVQLDPRVPQIVAQLGQIQQVVMNLIINAAEAIHAETGTVTVRTGRQMALPSSGYEPFNHGFPREYVYVQISDTGTGIEQDMIDRIFDPFFTTKPTGKGLGLAAVRDIIETHKGKITVESEVGEGTTITVFLPCRRDERSFPRQMH